MKPEMLLVFLLIALCLLLPISATASVCQPPQCECTPGWTPRCDEVCCIPKHTGHPKCTYKGTVASVDATTKTFVVHPAKGDDVTLKVNDKTNYGPKGRTWDDVKVDAKVSGTCKKDGADTWPVSVKFWPAPKAKAEPAAKTGK